MSFSKESFTDSVKNMNQWTSTYSFCRYLKDTGYEKDIHKINPYKSSYSIGFAIAVSLFEKEAAENMCESIINSESLVPHQFSVMLPPAGLLEEENNPAIIEIISFVKSFDDVAIRNSFPRLLAEENAVMRFFSCLGFIIGTLPFDFELGKKLAESFLRSFFLARGREDSDEGLFAIADDGSHFGFRFCNYLLTSPQDASDNVRVIGDKSYRIAFNGGILFHGFNNQTFAVSVDSSIGWQSHT